MTKGQMFLRSWTEGPSITPTFKNNMIKIQVSKVKKLKLAMADKNVSQMFEEIKPSDVLSQKLFIKPMTTSPPKSGAMAINIGPTIGTLDL